MRSATVVLVLVVALAIVGALAVACGHSPGTTFGVVTDGGKADGAAADGLVLPGDGGVASDASAAFDAGLCCTWQYTASNYSTSPPTPCGAMVTTLCADAGYGGGTIDNASCYPAHGTCAGPTGVSNPTGVVGSLAPCPVCTDGGGGCGGSASLAPANPSPECNGPQDPGYTRTVVCVYPVFCPSGYVCTYGTDGGPTCL